MHFNRCVSRSVRPSVRGQLVTMLRTLNHMVYFDQIMHNSAGNDQFAFHTYLLAPDTDESTFASGRAHWCQLKFVKTFAISFYDIIPADILASS